MWTEFGGRGLTIIGVPSNDFGGQEPGGPKEIAETAQHQYAVAFQIAPRPSWSDPAPIPFTSGLPRCGPKMVPKWNFHKYLIGRDGYIAFVFPSAVEPTDTRVKTAIAKAMAGTISHSSRN